MDLDNDCEEGELTDEKKMKKITLIHHIRMNLSGIKNWAHIPTVSESHRRKADELLEKYEKEYGEKYVVPKGRS